PGAKSREQCVAVELRIVPRAGDRPDIHQHGDVEWAEQRDELVERSGRVADRVDSNASPALRAAHLPIHGTRIERIDVPLEEPLDPGNSLGLLTRAWQ